MRNALLKVTEHNGVVTLPTGKTIQYEGDALIFTASSGDIVEWSARQSGGMNESAVLITSTGTVMGQCEFARHIRHVDGGSELYRYDALEGEIVLFLYQSGSGKTETAEELTGGLRFFDTWDEAEQALGLQEGSLRSVF